MIKDFFSDIASIFKNRIVPLALVFILLLSVIVVRLFSLQIINGSSYVKDLSSSIEKTMSTQAARGRIFDRNGVLLAYNDLVYAVKISDSGTYNSKSEKNATINNAIEKTLQIIEKNGDTFSSDMDITYDDTAGYQYSVSGNTLLGFLRDAYGLSNISSLSDEQRSVTPDQLIEDLCTTYQLNQTDYTPAHLLEILYLRINMTANSYSRYVTFTIATEVSDKTMAAILEDSSELVGVTVDQQYVRRYVDGKYLSAVIGYTGKASSSELETLQAENSDYTADDIVGKTGIEEALETELAGTKGSKQVYVDTVGRVTQVISETDSTPGHDVYLTIDINLQKNLYDILENELVSIVISHMSEGTTKYEYSSTGSVSNIYILMTEMYYALIENGMVSTTKIASQSTSTEQKVYAAYQTRHEQALAWVEDDLLNSPATYNSMNEEQQFYIWYVYTMMKQEGILNTDNIDTSDSMFEAWAGSDSGDISLQEFLQYAISQNWVNLSAFTDNQYSDLDEAYQQLVAYTMDILQTDDSFTKLVYKYLINDGTVSGQSVCMLLYEQGYLQDDGAAYAGLASGSLSPYSFLYNALNTKLITPGELGVQPSSGSAVVTDPNNGQILAMVSYPGYDNNKLSGTMDYAYYKQLQEYVSKPLYNWATQSRTAPGSTFKLCTTIASMDLGVISPSTSIYCSGQFTEVTPSPKCWIYPGRHGDETAVTAIRDSCNVFFNTVGYRLALSKDGTYNSTYATNVLQKYAEELGLATKSGIEIYEETPQASNTNAIASAIGQGNPKYSCLNMARYISTVAVSGTCYNSTLIDKVTDHDGNLIYQKEAVVADTVNVDSSIWDVVHEGTKEVVQYSYPAFNGLDSLKIAGKSGTAQENEKTADHANFVSYAPYDDPEVALAVAIPHGYASANSSVVTAEFYKYYFNTYKNLNN